MGRYFGPLIGLFSVQATSLVGPNGARHFLVPQLGSLALLPYALPDAEALFSGAALLAEPIERLARETG